MASVILKPLFHRKQECIAIVFDYSKEIQQAVQGVTNAKWSKTNNCWYIPCTIHHYERLKYALDKKARIDISELQHYLRTRKAIRPAEESEIKQATFEVATKHFLNDENLYAFQSLKNILILKGYSRNTMRVYCNEFHHLLRLLGNRSVNSLEKPQILSYLLWLIKDKKYSELHVHSTVNALKFYFEKVMKRPPEFYDLPRPKKPLKLPAILALEEVVLIIQKIENIKHRCMIMAGYAAGMRVSEIINLKIADIDSKRMMIHIRCAKGKKDRMVPLSKKLLEELRKYVKVYKPKEFLFEGQAGAAYSSRGAQQILQTAKEKAGIKKVGSMHSLRHSYATHLIESGTDIRYIQDLLGHNNITTTMRYTHVSKKFIGNIESPLDKLDW